MPQNQQVKKSVRHNLLIARINYQHTFIVSTIFAKKKYIYSALQMN
jgi:hypothetical protein